MKLRRSGKGPRGRYVHSITTPEISDRPQTVGQWIGVILVLGMFGLIGGVGVLTTLAGMRQFASGQQSWPMALLVIAIGLLFSAIGLGYFYIRYVKKPQREAEAARLEGLYPSQPWMRRKDWASRRVVYSNVGIVAMLWIWNIGWWGGLAIIGALNRTKILAALESSWWAYALGALFLLIGVGTLRLAIDATVAHLRFGRTTLRLDTLPAYVGEQFRGAVEARLKARPAAPLKAALVCDEVRWRTHRTGGKTTTKLTVHELQRIEHQIPASRILLSPTGARIPVEIDIPTGSREFALDREGSGIRWTLHIEAPGPSGAPFACVFEVPVYRRRG